MGKGWGVIFSRGLSKSSLVTEFTQTEVRKVSHIDIEDIPGRALGKNKQVQKSQGRSDPDMFKEHEGNQRS